MAFLGLLDANKVELSGRGYRRANMTRDRFLRRHRSDPIIWVRFPPAKVRWPRVHYIALFKKEQDRAAVDWGPLPHPRLAKKGDTIVVNIPKRKAKH